MVIPSIARTIPTVMASAALCTALITIPACSSDNGSQGNETPSLSIGSSSEPAPAETTPADIYGIQSPLPSLSELKSKPTDYQGAEFAFDGIVTNVSGGFRGSPYEIGIHYGSEDAVILTVPYKLYKESVVKGRTLHAFATYDGVIDGLPTFTAISYYEKAGDQ